MKPIRIINTQFEILGEIDDYESMFFTRRWHGIDDIEIRINRYKRYADILTRGNIIIVGSDLHKTFIIRHREIELTEEGKLSENWTIKGLGLESVISQRITVPPKDIAYDTLKSNAETVMRHYVNNNIVASTDPKRNIPQLTLAPNLNRGATVEWSSRYKNLGEEVMDISMYSGLGWGVPLDIVNKKWVFKVYEGRNLTVNQSALPPVIFSTEFDSLQSLQYLESDFNYKNSAYVAGQGEGELRRIVELGVEQTGLNRIELFVDARDVEEVNDDDTPIPVATINATLTERGRQKLSENLQELYVEGQILTKSPFKYEVDYDLGDMVTIREKSWGVTEDTRITEIKEIYETGGFRIEAVFGKDQPTLVDKIKDMVDAPLVEKDTDVYTPDQIDDKIAEVEKKIETTPGSSTTIVNSFNNINKSGFYDGESPAGAPGGGWWHLIQSVHSYTPLWSVQIAIPFGDPSAIYIRNSSQAGSTKFFTAWKKIPTVPV